MATFVRNRVLAQISWPDESECLRAKRREALCELDGLLTQLEEVNLRGGKIPTRVLVALRRNGVTAGPRAVPADLIEAVFSVQEQFMRQPLGAAAVDASALADLRRRLAS